MSQQGDVGPGRLLLFCAIALGGLIFDLVDQVDGLRADRAASVSVGPGDPSDPGAAHQSKHGCPLGLRGCDYPTAA